MPGVRAGTMALIMAIGDTGRGSLASGSVDHVEAPVDDPATSSHAAGPLLRRGPRPRGPVVSHDIRPADAGWAYVGFVEHRLEAGAGFERAPDDREVAVIVVDGSVTLMAVGQRYPSLGSRASPLEGPPAPVLLLAPGNAVEVRAESAATVVVADAPAAAAARTRLIDAGDILVESRGAGITERRIHHLLPPTAAAGRLILFEVITPGGHWSSYPPHKHDTEDPPREAYLEELYYYRFDRPEGWAFARVYTADRSLDACLAPRDRDVVLVARGYHPVSAAPGYDAYYLNVMAGPHRAWHFTLDAEHAWLMDWDPTRPR
jgi:5-deoxy-glucuronate isomerase